MPAAGSADFNDNDVDAAALWDCRVRRVGFPGIANNLERYHVEEAAYHQGVNP